MINEITKNHSSEVTLLRNEINKLKEEIKKIKEDHKKELIEIKYNKDREISSILENCEKTVTNVTNMQSQFENLKNKHINIENEQIRNREEFDQRYKKLYEDKCSTLENNFTSNVELQKKQLLKQFETKEFE